PWADSTVRAEGEPRRSTAHGQGSKVMQDMEPKKTPRSRAFLKRYGRIFWYSGELYYRSKLPAWGNSRITMILGSGPPSISLVSPLRTSHVELKFITS